VQAVPSRSPGIGIEATGGLSILRPEFTDDDDED